MSCNILPDVRVAVMAGLSELVVRRREWVELCQSHQTAIGHEQSMASADCASVSQLKTDGDCELGSPARDVFSNSH